MNRPPEKSVKQRAMEIMEVLSQPVFNSEGAEIVKHIWDGRDAQLVPEPPPLVICFYDNKNILCGTVACKDGKMTFEGNADESAKRLWQCWGGMFEGEVKKAAKAMCEQRLVDATGVSVPSEDVLEGMRWKAKPGFIPIEAASGEECLMSAISQLEQQPQVHLSKEDRARVLRVLGRSM